ncbi:helix-turn-helix transcriptional regulator [Rhodopirellula halodulae]|uniref:helix-turn-helix transcriptional regulator n=1 Tax=Rhodopirellula halodulae TaxID=2894198 RepID=UPI001E4C187F|nr:WYL domain-containing protein [Rhodopirellula sp. JC737]MCC9655444.1 WYL domain-containing protein [Rhodopirellula sp. JC737]
MARNEQLIRQHKLLQLLEDSRFGRTLDELRGDLILDLGLSTLHTRTVRRDLEALQGAGYDIQNEVLDRGRIYRLGRNHTAVHEIAFSATELIALSIGRELLYPLMGTQYWQGIETFWNKVQEAIPEGVYEHYQRYRKVLYVSGTPSKTYEAQSGMLKTINRAILEHRVVEIKYKPVGREASLRQIEPYGLAVHQNSIYVVAAAPEVTDESERLRNWKLDRFTQATVTDDYFKPDPKINLNEFLGKSIGIFSGDSSTQVKIRLGNRSASYLREDPWHPEQTLEPESTADSSSDFILTVPASHPRELLPKVLALGSDAEVLEPAEYREAVADVVKKLSQAYDE